jgi:hypothetical protein
MKPDRRRAGDASRFRLSEFWFRKWNFWHIRAMSILDNAASVLRCFGAGCPSVTVTEVTRLLGLPKTSASRLLRAMREAGMLETIGATKQHRHGRLMLDLAAAFRPPGGGAPAGG